MKNLRYKNLFLLLLITLTITGCLSNSGYQPAAPSSDASVRRVSILSSTYSPNASSAEFTIDNVNNIIYNIDSLPYGTKIDSLYLRFYFASTTGFIINDSVSESTGCSSDAVTSKPIDFTKSVKIKNLATDEKTTKEYSIELRVHQVETYRHVWSELNTRVTDRASDNQKAVRLNNKFFYYFGSTESNLLYTSTDAKTWEAEPALTGLPLNAKLGGIVVLTTPLTYSTTTRTFT